MFARAKQKENWDCNLVPRDSPGDGKRKDPGNKVAGSGRQNVQGQISVHILQFKFEHFVSHDSFCLITRMQKYSIGRKSIVISWDHRKRYHIPLFRRRYQCSRILLLLVERKEW